MSTYLAAFRRVAVTGLMFMLPVYVLLAILTRAWTSLSSLGTSLAGVFGVKSLIGVGASSVLSGIALLVIWFGCGLLAHVAGGTIVTVERSWTMAGWLQSDVAERA